MKKSFSTASKSFATLVRQVMIGLVILNVALMPVTVRASSQFELTATPSVTPTETSSQSTSTSQPTFTLTPTPTPVATPPEEISWLASASSPADLAHDQSLAILAGRLIFHGLVDVSSACNGASGLLRNGYASVCGEQAARKAVINWQNQFDQAIFDAATQYDVPPYLLKNLITQESQFWPARHLTIYKYYEYGLGHVTQMGADTLLRWNDAYSRSFCREVFTPETCKAAYAWMPTPQRDMLRGSVLQVLDASCDNCQGGVDLSRATASIPTIAATIKASYNHLEWMLGGITSGDVARTFDGSLLWRLTLASYNAGPGCITTAVHQVNNLHLKLTWKNISAQFDKGCVGAVEYVDRVSANPWRADPQTLASAMTDNSLASRLVFANLGIQTSTATPIPASVTPVSTLTLTPEPGSQTPTPTVSPNADSTPTPLALETTLTGTPATETPTPTNSITPEITLSPLTPEVTFTGTPATETPTPTTSTTPDITSSSLTPEVTPTGTLQIATASPTASSTSTAEGAEVQAPHVKDQLVIKLDPQNRGAGLQTLLELGLSLPSDSENIDTLDTFVVEVEPEKLAATLDTLKASDGIEYAEPNYLAQLASLPNDPYLPMQTGLTAMQVPEAWDVLPSLQDVVVAVVDSGVDANHPDLAERMWINAGEFGQDANGNDRRANGIDDDGNGYVDDWQGWNMVAGNNDAQDDQGHGTHIAGIIGATVNNSIGIAGIAPNARILPVKVLDSTGFGSYAQVAEGIIYATDMGARVINLGFGGTGSSELLQNAVDYAVAHGALVVAASGNGGTSTPYFPAAYPGVIAVSALGSDLTWMPFSSFGDHISLSAPGAGIYSTTLGNGYAGLSGSSMAAANVSGVAVLLAGEPQFANADSLRSALLGGALDLGAPGRDPYFGQGAVRALDALVYAGPILPTPTPWVVPTSTGPGGVYSQSLQTLWARGSLSTDQGATFAITNPVNSGDGAFNDAVGSSTGSYGGSAANTWHFDTIDDTGFSTIASAYLNIRLSFSGWVNDTYYIQVYEPTNPVCVLAGWCTVYTLKFIPAVSTPAPGEEVPPSSLTTLPPINVFSILNTRNKVNAARVRIAGSGATGGSADNVTIAIDGVNLEVQDVLPTSTPTATFTPTPTAILTATLPVSRVTTATPQANEPHNNLNLLTTDMCASCHRSHTAKSLSLGSQGEENTCFACHGASGPGTSIIQAFKANTATRFFSHGVSTSVNLHSSAENTGGAFGGSLRHIECEDCHAPHVSSRTESPLSNLAPTIQQEMYLSSGVNPLWDDTTRTLNGFSWVSTADREYQICFKCHSSFTTLPSYAPDGYQASTGYVPNGLAKLTNTNPAQKQDSRDLPTEFSPYQVSFHPVISLGRNREINPNSFVAPWSVNSMVYCSDCHDNASAPTNGKGPHGSSNLHLLTGSAEYITSIDPSTSCAPGGCPSIHNTGELCFKCHQYGTYAAGSSSPTWTRFRVGGENLHAFHGFSACYTCHDTHGSGQARLINFDVSQVAVGGNSENAWTFDASTGIGSCTVSCHGGDHDSSMYYQP